jgi:hypothetical protein
MTTLPPIPCLYIILFTKLVKHASPSEGRVTTKQAREILAHSFLGLDAVRCFRVLEELEAYGLIFNRTREAFQVNQIEVPSL